MGWFGDDLPRERLARLDVVGWLTKPVGQAQLYGALARALDASSAARRARTARSHSASGGTSSKPRATPSSRSAGSRERSGR